MSNIMLRIRFWLLVRCINWIGNHILVNGSMLTIERENDDLLHADIKRTGEE